MRFWMTIRALKDTITEEVAFKTGILLNDHEAREILKNSDVKEWLKVFDRDDSGQIGVRPEFIEDCVRLLRASLGNLPDTAPGPIVFLERCKKYHDKGIDIDPIVNALALTLESSELKVIGDNEVEEIAKISGMPLDIVIDVISGIFAWTDRDLSIYKNAKIKEWDGVVPLSSLFETESVPKKPDFYFDQRFIDYLAKNSENLDKIHWRNFERLCAEFFKRHEYEVELGPGSKDGGIDIRIWSDRDSKTGPPLLLIQCKRNKKGTLVKVEYIKSLWADVVFEGAEGGLLATTSQVTPAGKKICQARKYPLSFAENEAIKKWTYSMWRHALVMPIQTNVVGKYLLSPYVP